MKRRTAPEILRQMNNDVDAIVVGVGSGGTLTGIGRFMKRASPTTQMILADPVGSVLAPLIKTGKMTEAGSWAVEGIGEDFVPPNCDLSLVREAYSVSDEDSFAAARNLLREEGIFAGSSSGTLLTAALRYCRAQSEPKRVVSLVCNSGAKYLSKVFNDAFLMQEGWGRDAHRHRARSRDQSACGGLRDRGAAGGQSAHGVCAHARGRRVAIAGHAGRAHRGPDRRERYPGVA